MTQPSKSNQPKDQIKDKDQSKDKPSTGKDTKEIAAEVDQTRSAITSDIRELNEKFSSANVKESAKEVLGGVKDAAVEQAGEIKDVVVDKMIEVKDAVVDKATEVKDVAAEKIVEAKDAVLETMEDVGEQAKRAGAATWRFTKANAVPLALFGAGAAWLVANNRRRTGRQLESERYRSDYDDGAWADDAAEELDGHPEQRRAASELSRRPASSRSRSASRTASAKPTPVARLGARAQGAMDEASDGLERAGHVIADKTSQGATYVRDSLRRVGTTSLEFTDANPMLVALAAITAGVGIGMLLPSTERENQLFAPPREKFKQLIGDVRDVATDVVEVAKDTANESMKALT